MIESMYGMGVDTLKAARTLEKAGFDSAQAEAHGRRLRWICGRWRRH